jgi:FlaA1/EpsC-like NDP-sugar epimerase
LSLAVQQYCINKGLSSPAVQIIGTRPGEKLHEELLSEVELTNMVEDEELYVVLPAQRSEMAFWHFKPSAATFYRSDKAPKVSIEQLLTILSSYREE